MLKKYSSVVFYYETYQMINVVNVKEKAFPCNYFTLLFSLTS